MRQKRYKFPRILEAPLTDIQALEIAADELLGVKRWVPSWKEDVAQNHIVDVTFDFSGGGGGGGVLMGGWGAKGPWWWWLWLGGAGVSREFGERCLGGGGGMMHVVE